MSAGLEPSTSSPRGGGKVEEGGGLPPSTTTSLGVVGGGGSRFELAVEVEGFALEDRSPIGSRERRDARWSKRGDTRSTRLALPLDDQLLRVARQCAVSISRALEEAVFVWTFLRALEYQERRDGPLTMTASELLAQIRTALARGA